MIPRSDAIGIAEQPIRAAGTGSTACHAIGREILARPRRWPSSRQGWQEVDRAVAQTSAEKGLGGALFLNVSAASLMDDSGWSHLLHHFGQIGGPLVVELPESLCCTHLARPRIADLRNLGAWVALDDFGSGFSDLPRVQQLDLDLLKIDYCPASRGNFSDYDLAKVRDEAARRGIQTVIEGIEEEADIAYAQRLGATGIQGFHIGQPTMIEEAVKNAI